MFLNDRYLLRAHAHVSSSESPLAIDRTCVSYDEIVRLLSGRRYVERRGTNLDGVTLGAGTGAALRVQRRGRISSRVHRNDDRDYIPLLDLVRALGARIVRNGSYRINLVLESSSSGAILALNDLRPRRRQ